MDRRTFIRSSLATVAVSGLPGCFGSNGSSGTRPRQLDPSIPVSRISLRLPGGGEGFPSPFTYTPGSYGFVSYMYDSLLWEESRGKLIPWLASRHQRSPEGLVHTFHLRRKARWHDGKPVTARDVVFSFDYFMKHEPELPPFVLFRPNDVRDVRATDATTVQVMLTKPAVTFSSDIGAFFPIVPEHVWSAITDPVAAQDPEVLIGSGPYRLQSQEPAGGGYLFVANDRFFLGKPFVERIEHIAVGDELSALLAGETDAAGFVFGPPSPGALDRLRDDPEFRVTEGPLDFAIVLYFNLDHPGAPSDRRFRQACAYAIDRNDLVQRLLHGVGEPGNPGFLPPDHPMHVDVPQYPYDPAAAHRLLDDAGYEMGQDGVRVAPDGTPLRFTLRAVPEVSVAVEVVVASLKELGVQLRIDPVEPFRISSQDSPYEMALAPHGNLSADPDFMRVVFSSTEEPRFFSPVGYDDAKFNEVAAKQAVTLDSNERRKLVARMQHIVAEDLPYLHLYYPRPLSVYRRRVFDYWEYEQGTEGPANKQAFVTGRNKGTEIRPIKGS